MLSEFMRPVETSMMASRAQLAHMKSATPTSDPCLSSAVQSTKYFSATATTAWAWVRASESDKVGPSSIVKPVPP